jgi:hypothetical protein
LFIDNTKYIADKVKITKDLNSQITPGMWERQESAEDVDK